MADRAQQAKSSHSCSVEDLREDFRRDGLESSSFLGGRIHNSASARSGMLPCAVFCTTRGGEGAMAPWALDRGASTRRRNCLPFLMVVCKEGRAD